MRKTITRFLIAVILALGLLSSAARAQRPERGHRAPSARRPFSKPGTPRQAERIRFYDVKHIKAELTLKTGERAVIGTVTHTLSPLHPYLTQIELDSGRALKVARVTVGNQPCKFTTKDDKLSVTLDKPYGPDDTINLAIDYSGSPTHGLHFVLPDPAYPEKPLSIWTQGESEDTHHWLPCYDFPNERATTEMIITVEKPLFVVSNGTLLETRERSSGMTTYHWKMDVPHVSYLISLAVGDFAVYHDRVGNLPLDYYVAKNVDEPTARRFMGKTPEMLRYFNEVTGQPYPYVKYAQTCLPEFNGGMENISATSMTDRVLRDEIAALEGDADGLVAHELAHQWFGDLLTCKDWSHIWLNEGFASYFDPLFMSHTRGDETFRVEMANSLRSYLGQDREYRRAIVEPRYETSMAMFDAMTYSKGACVLHTLRGLLGDDAWWKGLRGYVAAHKFQVVETDDFRKAMEAGSGKDLKWFFDQWVYKAGHPELKVRWHYEDADKTVRVHVQQTQKVDAQTPLFRLPTTLELTDAPGEQSVIPIVIDGATHEFVIPRAVKPRMVQIDPQHWLIKELDFEKSFDENLFQLQHAASVMSRLEAASALANSKSADDKSKFVAVFPDACRREKAVLARTEMIELLCNGDEIFRGALIHEATDRMPRVRAAALGGLAKLKHDSKAEAVARAAWNKPREAYGVRKSALTALVAWKVKDSDDLLAAALKISANRHSIAAAALKLMLAEPGPKARELAALYSRYGQPAALRSTALAEFATLARDDVALQDLLVTMVSDPDRSVRFAVWNAVRTLKLTRAYPSLKAQLADDTSGFSGFAHRMLEDLLEALNEQGVEPAAANPAAASAAQTIAELERQAGDIEAKSKELKSRISALKNANEQGGHSAAKSTTGATPPNSSTSR